MKIVLQRIANTRINYKVPIQRESSRKILQTRTRKRQRTFDTFERFHIGVSLKVPLQIAICDKWFSTCRTSEKISLQCVFSCVPVDCYFGQRIQNIPNILHLASVKWHMPLRIRGMRKQPGALLTPVRFSPSTHVLLWISVVDQKLFSSNPEPAPTFPSVLDPDPD
jgi:hypothetical protein